MSIDERLQALAMNLELLHREVQDLKAVVQRNSENIGGLFGLVQQDAENVRGLARIAEIHERRLTRLEGGEQ